MAFPNGTPLNQLKKYGYEDDHLRRVTDERKRKRMISNRESARRSRMKKHKYLDELIAQVDQLKEENNGIVTNINMVNQFYLNMEAENSVLKAQMDELSHRMQSLEEIINHMNSANGAVGVQGTEDLWNFNGETVNNVNDFLITWDFAPCEYHGFCQ